MNKQNDTILQEPISPELMQLLDGLFKSHEKSPLSVNIKQNELLSERKTPGIEHADVLELIVGSGSGNSSRATVVKVKYTLNTPIEELQEYQRQVQEYWAKLQDDYDSKD